jgi:hypothetical protein
MSDAAQKIAEPAAGTVPLAFADVDGAKQWSKGLPLLPVGQAYSALMTQLGAMGAQTLAPRERARMVEVLRDSALHLRTELGRRFAGKPQPASEREQDAADQVIAMWQAFWAQYSMCLKPMLEGDPGLEGVRSKLLQRGLFVGMELVLAHGLARRVPAPAFWQELHAYYRLAEILECTVQSVSDDSAPHAVGLSCYSTYTHALLLALADPWAMTVRQIEFTDRWLAQWGRKLFPYAQQRETEGPLIVVDLDMGAGAAVVAAPPQDPPPSMRFCYPSKLATSVRGRLKRLAQGATPAELGIGQDLSSEQAVALLSHLDLRWHQVPRRTEASTLAIELCGGGLPGVYFRIAGRSFDRQDPLGRLSYSGVQHLSTLGALTDYDRHREEAERRWPWERWQGHCDWREASLARVDAARHRWFLEQLVVLRDGERTRVGYVTRVALDPSGTLSLDLKPWPGVPRALAMRPLASAYSEDPPLPVLELVESRDEPPTVLLPPRTFAPGRELRSMESGPERRLRLTKLLQRGADFERAAFEETA